MLNAGETIVYRAVEDEPSEEFLAKVKLLLGDSAPTLLWVDNTSWNYRYWKLFPLFAANSTLIRDAHLFLGGYFLTLHKNAVINRSGDGAVIGGYTFSRGGYTYTGSTACIGPDGVVSFPIEITDAAEPDIGIYYNTAAFDEITGRYIINTLYSPVIRPGEMLLDVEFFPSYVKKNKLRLKAQLVTETHFSTIYTKPVELAFPDGFAFVISEKADKNSVEYYYAPDGEAEARTAGRLMLGLSGSEYVSLAVGDRVCFHAGQAAYFEEQAISCEPDTAYLSFPDSKYYTQPQLSGFYDTSGVEGVYGFSELVGVMAGDACYPIFPYMDGVYDADGAARLEGTYISALRRKRIEEVFAYTRTGNSEVVYAVTRHGMKAAMRGGELEWLRVASTGAPEPDVAFTRLSPRFLLGMLASNLFLPLTDISGAETPYTISEDRLDTAKAHGYRDAEALKKLSGTVYLDAEGFTSAVSAAGAEVTAAILDACDNFNVRAAGWLFQMSARQWKKNGTVFVVKHSVQNSLSEYVEAPESWSVGHDETTRALIQSRLAAVARQNESISNRELDRILNSRDWCGTVAFSVGVDLKSLPAELSFLANGIKPELFKALYFAVSADSVEDGGVGRVSALINYQDDTHLNYEEEKSYGFKVLSLRLEILNGRIAMFSARVELLINRLFNGRATGYGSDTGSNIVFNGSYQQDEAGGYYAFVISQPQSYYIQSSAIEHITVSTAALRAGSDRCLFVLGGDAALYKHEGMDVFSYDRLGFGGFTVSMTASGGAYEFSDKPESFAFSLEESIAREGSFAAGFPAVISGLTHSPGKTAEEMDFTQLRVKGAVSSGELGRDWFGVLWRIDTGNLGGLAASAKLVIEVLTAWSRNPETEIKEAGGVIDTAKPIVYTGVRIASAGLGDSWSLGLQGIMTLGFDSIELHGGEEYYFKFRNFSLKILGARFPDTNNDMFLITDKSGRLGWYGASAFAPRGESGA